VFSYFPPTTPFVMVMRLSSPAHPVPVWELALSIVVGFAGVGVAVWFAAKVFRVGVLMYGKPPSLLTLIKWVRYA
jgi:ABC-2 type transport system permease protein